MTFLQRADQAIARSCLWDGRLNRSQFLRRYILLAIAELFLGVIAKSISPALYAWFFWAVFVFIAYLIFFRVIERLRDSGHSWKTALLLLVPFLNVYAIYLIFLKKGSDDVSKNVPERKEKVRAKKIIVGFLLVAFMATSGIFLPLSARAGHILWLPHELPKLELPKIEFPKIELPKIELPRLEIPFSGVVVDFNKGLGMIDDIKAQVKNLPDKIEIPGTSFAVYPKESIEKNIVNNVAPMLGEVVGFLDPAKPLASLARTIISKGKPYFDQYIKPYIAPDIKNFFHKTLNFIKDIKKAKDIPLIGGAASILWDMVVGPIDDLGVDLVELLAEESSYASVAPCRYCKPLPAPPSVPPEVVAPPPFVNQTPVGWLDRIDEKGVAYGWARDMNDPGRSIKVRIFINLYVSNPPDPSRGSYFTADIDANVPRSDVSATSHHGFAFVIPVEWRSDVANTLFAYAIDANDGSLHPLGDFHKKFKLSVPPVGMFESADEDGIVKGWMYDPYGFDTDQSWPKFVTVYEGEKDKGGLQAREVRPGSERKDVSVEALKMQFANRWTLPPGAAKGFEEWMGERFRDGKPRMLYAYAVREKCCGEKDEYALLQGSPKRFIYPRPYTIGFQNTFIDNVPRGGALLQTVLNLPNYDHRMGVTLDGKEIIDMSATLHGHPFNVPFETKHLSIARDPALGETRFFPLSIKLPENIGLEKHYITVRHHDPEGGVAYEGSFTFRVIPHELMRVEVPSQITAGEEMTLKISNIPPGISLVGSSAQAVVESIAIASGWQTSGLPYGKVGSVAVSSFSTTQNADGTVTVQARLPPEAARVRKGEGEVIVRVIFKARDKENLEVRNALQLSWDDGRRAFEAKTSENKNPTLTSGCAFAGEPALFFEEYVENTGMWKERIVPKRYQAWVGDGSRHTGSEADRVTVSGKNFNCFSKLAVEISGSNDEKPFTISSAKNAVGFWDEKNPIEYIIPDSAWDGSFRAKEDGIVFTPTEGWYRRYNDAEGLTIRVTDAGGRSAETKASLIPKYRVRAASVEGEKELRVGSAMRLWFKHFPVNHKLAINVDTESLRNIYVEKPYSGTFEGEKMEYTDDIFVPTWLDPGKHTLRVEDLSDLDEKGKPKYRATTKFTVGGRAPGPLQEGDKKTVSGGGQQSVLERKIEVTPSKTKPGEHLTLKMLNFSPGVLTVRLTNPSDASFTPIRLSGSFDYTDSSGSLTKQVTLPSVAAGTYLIVAQDILNQTAQTPFIVEALPRPAPNPAPQPPPQLTPAPLAPAPFPSPGPSPAPSPQQEEGTVPSCPVGSTYSFTFKQCIEENPQKQSPYDGLPCPPEGSVPSYTTKGCISGGGSSSLSDPKTAAIHLAAAGSGGEMKRGLFSGFWSFFAKLTSVFTGKKASDTAQSSGGRGVGQDTKSEEKTNRKDEGTKSSYSKKNVAGSFRCWSYNTGSSAGGGGITGGESKQSIVPSTLGLGQGCRLFAPIVLKEDGKYEMSKEKGTWKVQGDTVVLSESKIRGPGKILEGGMQIRFEYEYNNSRHIITYLREGETKKAQKGQKFIELTAQVHFPEGDYSADSVNTVTLFDKGTGEQAGESVAYPLDRSTIESWFSKRPPKIGVETEKIYNVFVGSGFGSSKVGEIDLRGVNADITKKIFVKSDKTTTTNTPSSQPESERKPAESNVIAPSPAPPPSLEADPNAPPCNPLIPKYNQPGCRGE